MNPSPARPALRLLLAALGGGLFPLGLAPFNHWWLSILSGALFCLLLGNLPARRVFHTALAYGAGMFGVGVSWVYISIHTHGGESVAIALLLTSLFVLLLTLCFAIPFTCYALLDRSRLAVRLPGFAAVWVLVEWVRGWIFTGFPWLYLGNAFVDTWLAGWAPLGGVLLLSLIGAFTAAALVELTRLRRHYSHWLLPVTASLVLWLAGAELRTRPWTVPAATSLSLAMVQPSLTPSQKWDAQMLYDILVQLREQSEAYWHNDVMIWPESAIPDTRQTVGPYLDAMGEIAALTNTTLVTGIPIKEQGRYYNGVIVLGEGEEGSYRKRHLVPFGEYIPLDSLLRGIIAFFDRPMSSFSPGENHQPLLSVRGVPVATAICYEIVFQDLVSQSARDAQVILTLSNDVWFGDSIAPHQHLQMARLRAIENGKPVVRDTNDGITAVIDASGQVTARLPQFTRGTLEAPVTPHVGTTPFNRFGSWPVVAASLLTLGLAGWFGRRRR